MLFKTTRPDGRSYRDVAVDIFKDLKPETIVSYETIGKALDLDPESGKLQGIVRSANNYLLKVHNRGLVNIPGKGYRVVQAREHMMISTHHQNKATRSMRRCVEWLAGTKEEELSENERKLHRGQCIIVQAILASHQHLDSRINKIEKLLQGNTTIQGN